MRLLTTAPVEAHACTRDQLMTPTTTGHMHVLDTSMKRHLTCAYFTPQFSMRSSHQHPGCDGGTTTAICIVALNDSMCNADLDMSKASCWWPGSCIYMLKDSIGSTLGTCHASVLCTLQAPVQQQIVCTGQACQKHALHVRLSVPAPPQHLMSCAVIGHTALQVT